MRHHAFRFVCPVLFVLTTALVIGFACSDKSTGLQGNRVPQVVAIEPDSGIIGQQIIIHGRYFGDDRGSVYFGEIQAGIGNWLDTLIQAYVPRAESPCIVSVQNSYGTSNSQAFTIIDIEDLPLEQQIQMINNIEIYFRGYNCSIKRYEFSGAVDYNTSCGYGTITMVIDSGDITFDSNGISFSGYLHTEINEGSLYDHRTVDISGYFSENGNSIDSIFAVAYGSYIDGYAVGEWRREVKAVTLPLQHDYNLYTGIAYEVSGSECRNHVLSISVVHSYTVSMPDNRTTNYYFSTDWDNAEYPPKIRVVFRKR